MEALGGVSKCIEHYDSIAALDILMPLCENAFGQAADNLLSELVSRLERFDFEKALETIAALEAAITII